MNSPTKLLIVDDHEIVLSGLSELLRSFSQPLEISTAASGEEALQIISSSYNKPNVVLSDLDMAAISGKELCRRIKLEYPDIQVIILSMHNEKGLIRDLVNVGANGYLTKGCSRAELQAALSAVLRGKKFFSTEVLESLSQDDEVVPETNMFLRQLSHRELEILKLTGNGWSSKEIGSELNISYRTVEAHRNNVMKKLNAKNTAGLIKLAVKSGLID